MDTYNGTVTLVDDEQMIVDYLTQALILRGASVVSFQNGDKALEFFLSVQPGVSNPKVMVVDDKLVGSTVTGLGIVGKIREVDKDSVLILISGSHLAEEVQLAAGLRIDAFLQKPFSGEVLMSTIKKAIAVRSGSVVADAVKSVTGGQSKDNYLKAIVCFILLGLTAWCVSNRIADAHWQGQIEGTLKSDQQHTQQLLKIMKDDVDMSWAFTLLLRDQMKESGLKPPALPKRPNYSEELEK